MPAYQDSNLVKSGRLVGALPGAVVALAVPRLPCLTRDDLDAHCISQIGKRHLRTMGRPERSLGAIAKLGANAVVPTYEGALHLKSQDPPRITRIGRITRIEDRRKISVIRSIRVVRG